MSIVENILADVALPAFAPARQRFDSACLDDGGIRALLESRLLGEGLLDWVRPGWKVAVTAGSRGICRVAFITKTVTDLLARRGAKPYIVGCMGSHGGDAAGQRNILAHLGITGEYLGVPVLTSDKVVAAGTTPDGRIVFADASVAETDALVVVNRIKPHTAFHAPVESGLQKMLAVGLGKRHGAQACHVRGFDGMYDNVTRFARVIMERFNVALGVGIIENAYGEVADCAVMRGSEIAAREPALLERARALMPRLLIDKLDVLVVSEMGKDISGSGMDTNIIGRYPVPGMTGGPDIDKLAALALTDGSEGNAHGVGFADFISARLFRRIDMERTYPNCLTNKVAAPAKIPPVMPNDRCAVQAAVKICAQSAPEKIRAMWIRNTHALDRVYLSPALLPEAEKIAGLEVCGPPEAIAFDEMGTVDAAMWEQGSPKETV